ncbi:MAG: T9SS type A sorting domain-containing protein [Ignavibacteriae bacterium]|nr:T9SS type A sorting domain-containing protein [Ignavibacteriota bacterium]
MAQPNPIRVALNMHSAYACKRYFVYHTAAGTSSLFATMQQTFIGYARTAFPGGIEPYTYFTSWPSTPPPTQYPESWFWYNHHEAVLANTYEDKNCTAAGGYDSTASAILIAVGKHLGILTTTSVAEEVVPSDLKLEQNYPNPFNPTTTIRFALNPSLSQQERVFEERVRVILKVYDVLGREVATLVNENLAPGSYETDFSALNLSSGIYLYRLESGNSFVTKRMTLLK